MDVGICGGGSSAMSMSEFFVVAASMPWEALFHAALSEGSSGTSSVTGRLNGERPQVLDMDGVPRGDEKARLCFCSGADFGVGGLVGSAAEGCSFSAEVTGIARRHTASSEPLLLLGGHWEFKGADLGTAGVLFTTAGGFVGRISGLSRRRGRSVGTARVGRA